MRVRRPARDDRLDELGVAGQFGAKCVAVAVDDGVTGTLVAGHDVERWTAAVEATLASPDTLTRMGEAAAAHARRFSWSATADHLLDSYHRAVTDYAAAQRGLDDARSARSAAPAGASARPRRWTRRRAGIRA